MHSKQSDELCRYHFIVASLRARWLHWSTLYGCTVARKWGLIVGVLWWRWGFCICKGRGLLELFSDCRFLRKYSFMKLGKRMKNQALRTALFWAITRRVTAEFLYGDSVVLNILLVTTAGVLWRRKFVGTHWHLVLAHSHDDSPVQTK